MCFKGDDTQIKNYSFNFFDTTYEVSSSNYASLFLKSENSNNLNTVDYSLSIQLTGPVSLINIFLNLFKKQEIPTLTATKQKTIFYVNDLEFQYNQIQTHIKNNRDGLMLYFTCGNLPGDVRIDNATGSLSGKIKDYGTYHSTINCDLIDTLNENKILDTKQIAITFLGHRKYNVTAKYQRSYPIDGAPPFVTDTCTANGILYFDNQEANINLIYKLDKRIYLAGNYIKNDRL